MRTHLDAKPMGLWRALLLLALVLSVLGPVFYLAQPLIEALPVTELLKEMISNCVVNVLVAALCLMVGTAVQGQPLRAALPHALPGGMGCWALILFASVLLAVGGTLIAAQLDNLLMLVAPQPDVSEGYFEEIVTTVEYLPFTVFLLCVVAPVTEEYLFRGLLQRGLLRRYRPWVAIVASAVCFSLYHENPAQFFYTFVLGLLLGWTAYRTESLVPPLIIHAVANGLDMLLYYGFGILIPGYNAEGLLQPWWSLVLGLMLLCAGASFLLLAHTPKEQAKGEDVSPSPLPAPSPAVRDPAGGGLLALGLASLAGCVCIDLLYDPEWLVAGVYALALCTLLLGGIRLINRKNPRRLTLWGMGLSLAGLFMDWLLIWM